MNLDFIFISCCNTGEFDYRGEDDITPCETTNESCTIGRFWFRMFESSNVLVEITDHYRRVLSLLKQWILYEYVLSFHQVYIKDSLLNMFCELMLIIFKFMCAKKRFGKTFKADKSYNHNQNNNCNTFSLFYARKMIYFVIWRSKWRGRIRMQRVLGGTKLWYY